MGFIFGIGKIGCRMLVVSVLLSGALWLISSQVRAAPMLIEENAPEIILPSDGIAFRNLVESGDLFVIFRYNLPFDDSEDATDPAWAEFGVEGVLMRLIWVEPPAIQERQPPQLGHAIGVFYLDPGHGASWGSADLFIRMQGNPSLFQNVNVQTRPIDFSAAGADSATLVKDSATRRDALCDVFTDELQAVESADPDLAAGDLVNGGVITDAGTTMAVAAFSGAISLLPDCFVVGVTSTGQEFDPSNPQLRDDLITEVEATDYWASWSNFWNSHNMDPVLWSTFIGIGVSLAVAIGISMIAGVAFGGTSGLATLLFAGLMVPHHLVQIFYVIVAILGILSLAYFWQRVPR